jgi:GDP-fucose protein O-fucosyltransferase
MGAQLLFPQHIPSDGTELPGVANKEATMPFDSIYDTEMFFERVREIYNEFWCARPNSPQYGVWCEPDSKYNPVLQNEESRTRVLEIKAMSNGSNWVTLEDDWSEPRVTEEHGERLFREFSGSKLCSGVLSRKCSLFSLKVKEGDIAWDLFWNIDSGLKFSRPITDMVRTIQSGIFGAMREVRSSPPAACRGNLFKTCWDYNVLHLRIERDWEIHCKSWMGIQDGIFRDNCMNNSKKIHYTLLSEGVPRMSTIYVSTAMSRTDLLLPEFGLQGLFEHFNVVTKDSILHNVPRNWTLNREWWAAVDTQISSEAATFVGNSVSTFSAFVILWRQHWRMHSWHYNGGTIPLVEAGIIRPRRESSVPTYREQIKWVFAIHEGSSALSKSFPEMLRAAVLSAKEHTKLIPICVTTSSPSSELVAWMIDAGVRVLHHEPAWVPQMTRLVAQHTSSAKAAGLAGNEQSHLLTDPAAMIGTFLRIDIPIVGMLDEFVLYTDIDVLFTGPVTWKTIFPHEPSFEKVKTENDFARGFFSFGEPGQFGVPQFFAVASEMEMRLDPNFMNAGVMLLNMRSLRDTHDQFVEFICAEGERTGSMNFPAGPGDQGAYKEFYKLNRENGSMVHGSLLPFGLNWKSYWKPFSNSSIVHFHGPKCRRDIFPYFETGELGVPAFQGILKACNISGNCLALCQAFDSYAVDKSLPPP